MPVALHIWVSIHIHHLIVFFVAQVVAKWWHLQMFFFFNFSKFWFSGLSQELYLMWLRFLVHISKMISPTIFHFFKIQIFQVFQNSSINAKRKLWGVHHLFHKCVIFYLSLMIQIVVLILVSCIYYSFFFLSFLLLIFGIFKYADLLKIMF